MIKNVNAKFVGVDQKQPGFKRFDFGKRVSGEKFHSPTQTWFSKVKTGKYKKRFGSTLFFGVNGRQSIPLSLANEIFSRVDTGYDMEFETRSSFIYSGAAKRMLEKDVEAYLVKKVREAGGRAYKFVSPGNVGVPDRIIIFPGARIAFAELKAPGRKMTPIQEAQAAKLRGLGADVCVLDSKQGVDAFVARMSW